MGPLPECSAEPQHSATLRRMVDCLPKRILPKRILPKRILIENCMNRFLYPLPVAKTVFTAWKTRMKKPPQSEGCSGKGPASGKS
ncbi:MAG: hypothetical protein VX768_05425 [Planctomycetota bacterium]|nr:hypothetical protein [Planctomycetota bacterium]